MNKRGKIFIGHTKIAILVSCLLALVTILAVSLTSVWSIRDVYNVSFFFLLSLNILLTNAFFFSRKRKHLSDSFRKVLRISIIVIYIFAYLAAVGGYISTGQIIRLQTILFMINMQALLWFLVALLVLGLFLAIVIFPPLITTAPK